MRSRLVRQGMGLRGFRGCWLSKILARMPVPGWHTILDEQHETVYLLQHLFLFAFSCKLRFACGRLAISWYFWAVAQQKWLLLNLRPSRDHHSRLQSWNLHVATCLWLGKLIYSIWREVRYEHVSVFETSALMFDNLLLVQHAASNWPGL